MRILIDGRTIQDHFPGIGRYVYNLADALASEQEDELWLLAYDAKRSGRGASGNTQYDLDALARHPNLRLIPTDIPVFHLREQTHLPALIRELAPDIVHFPYNVRPLRRLPMPAILTLYDAIPRRFPHYFPRARRWLIETIQRLALRASDAFVAISAATARDFQALYHVQPERITVAPLAADPIFRPQPPESTTELRVRLNLPTHYALYLGSNKPHKNLPRLVEAWARVSGHDRSRSASADAETLHLVIAGAWDERYPEAKRLAHARHLDHVVHFLGPVANKDLPALYAAADLFLFPSLYEGFGLPVLEAMACGTPVACSNTSSLPEIVGDAARLFDPASIESMTEAILNLWRNSSKRQELTRRGLERAAQFTWRRTAQLTRDAYVRASKG
ncbi:MAG: glycosyltransferase family 4 protein [Chloroflexi bacterium]|nr:glycosyltransferase family 4 protein [Chloroflexota bacterium]